MVKRTTILISLGLAVLLITGASLFGARLLDEWFAGGHQARAGAASRSGAPAPGSGRYGSHGTDHVGRPEDGVRAANRQGYTGSTGCRPCHERFYSLWAPSRHGRAMQLFSPELAERDLSPQVEPLRIGAASYQVSFEDGKGWVVESGPQPEKRYPIRYVLGGKNVAYFLTAWERGRLQVLPVAYDVRRREWYDTTASAVRHFPDLSDEALDWTERPLTFNASCYGCHVSQLATNYDVDTDTYHTTWSEPGINCETCHGPGSEHVRVCEEAAPGAPPLDLRIIRTKIFNPAQTNALCAPCHAKMIPITAGFVPGESFFDHYDLVAYEHPDYYPDGRDLGENYTYTSWLTSPCVSGGQLDCLHCHTSSGRYRFAGEEANDACLPCHQDHVSDPERHTRHEARGEGGRCIACHMPKSEFARMARTDHSMRPPAPAASIAFGSPNACNLCHRDKDAAWADQWVRRWSHRDYQAPVLRRARLVAAARKHDGSALEDIMALLEQPDRDPVVAASLVRLLEPEAGKRAAGVLVRLARSDPSPLVRSSAVAALGLFPSAETRRVMRQATGDAVRLVRVRAAQALAGSEAGGGAGRAAESSVQRAEAEYLASLTARPDDPASYHNLGNDHLNRGEWDEAARCFETAARLQPRGVGSLVNEALAHNLAGRNEEAVGCLRRALDIDRDNAAANLNLGLLLGELGRPSAAAVYLKVAAEADPPSATAAYNLGVVLGVEDPQRAVPWCRRAARLAPDEPRYARALAFYLCRAERWGEAIDVLTETVARHPGDEEARARLGELFERLGETDRARQLYRETLERATLGPETRRELARRLEALGAGSGGGH